MKDKVVKTIKMIFCLFLIASSYNLFVVPINLVAGGSGGVGVLFSYIFGIDNSLTVLIVSFILLILSFIFLDKKQIYSLVIVTIFFPIAIKVTSPMSLYIDVANGHKLILTIYGAIITGIGQGFVLKEGLNTGGFTVISKIVYKYTKFSITATTAVINTILIVISSYFIGVDMMLYAIIYIAIMAFVSERIMLGSSSNKTFKIISDRYEEIQAFIHDELFHDVTLYDVKGFYDKEKAKMIMVVIPTSEFITLKDFINSVDKNAFIFVTNTYEADKQDKTIRKAMA